jgi:hypothetical protein
MLVVMGMKSPVRRVTAKKLEVRSLRVADSLECED